MCVCVCGEKKRAENQEEKPLYIYIYTIRAYDDDDVDDDDDVSCATYTRMFRTVEREGARLSFNKLENPTRNGGGGGTRAECRKENLLPTRTPLLTTPVRYHCLHTHTHTHVRSV